MAVQLTQLPLKLLPDPNRVIARLFSPGDVRRAGGLIRRVLAIPEEDAERLLEGLRKNFRTQHPELLDLFEEHYEQLRGLWPDDVAEPSLCRRRLIGAYFTMEYALESVALFNPSIVPAVDQEGVPPRCVRFLMSLRAVGSEYPCGARHGPVGVLGALADFGADTDVCMSDRCSMQPIVSRARAEVDTTRRMALQLEHARACWRRNWPVAFLVLGRPRGTVASVK